MPILTRLSSWRGVQASTPEPESFAAPAADENGRLKTGKVLRKHPASGFTALAEQDVRHVDRAASLQAAAALRDAIHPLRQELLLHPVYDAVSTLPRLRRFMAIHVYAVWDFMCLTRRLQGDLTSLAPLGPVLACSGLAHLINQLELDEESDGGAEAHGFAREPSSAGAAISHVQLYLAAMEEIGAPTQSMRRFLSLLAYGAEVEVALAAADAPTVARTFILRTLACAAQGGTAEVLSAFLYGGEDLIPAMFSRLLPHRGKPPAAPNFGRYIARQRKLDGELHGPVAERALAELCGDDREDWQAARRAAERAIRAHLELWDEVHTSFAF
jgi:hypothetical protein